MKVPNVLVFMLASLCLITAGCGKKSEGKESQTSFSHAMIDNSLYTEDLRIFEEQLEEDSSGSPKKHLVIAKSALGKSFLFQSSQVEQAMLPAFQAHGSRVIYFRQVGDDLIMMEDSSLHQMSPNLKLDIVLAKFPIIKTSETEIFFDFNTGMSKLFMIRDLRAYDHHSDFDEPKWLSYPVEDAFVSDARHSADGAMVIEQIARLFDSPVKLVYYLAPFKVNRGFTPTITKFAPRIGFFQAGLRYVDQQPTIFAAKFDVRKPLVFYISANTPKEYRRAVTQGVLYWNKAFGRKFLSVKQLKTSVQAPSYEHNIIQWIEHNDAAFAYADWHLDPTTGEMLHAQVYLTSSFAIDGKETARKVLRGLAIKDEGESSEVSTKKLQYEVGLRGFQSESICEHESLDALSKRVRFVLKKNWTDTQILKMSQDIIRQKVAHEVGHILGFRHNFAGSMETNLDAQDYDKAVETYLKDGELPGDLVLTSSVMDYFTPEYDAMVGEQIASNRFAFRYDEMAVKTLYDGFNYQDEDIPAFCSDSDLFYWDCVRWDFGTSLVDFYKYESKEAFESIPAELLSSFMAASARGLTGDKLAKGTPSVRSLAVEVYRPRGLFLQGLSEEAKFLKVRRLFPAINEGNLDFVRAKEREEMLAMIHKAGGLDELLRKYGPADIESLKRKYLRALIKPSFNVEGEDLVLMKAEGERFFEQLGDFLQRAEIGTLIALPIMKQDDLTADLEAIVTDRVIAFILATTGEYDEVLIKTKDQGELTARLPNFKFDLDLRLKALTALAPKGPASAWGREGRDTLREAIQVFMTKSFGCAPEQVVGSADKKFKRWLGDFRKIFKQLEEK